MIRLFKVFMAPEAPQRAKRVLRSGYIGEGQEVKTFEGLVKGFIHNEKFLMVNSGTSAIMLALRLAGVEPGDYVISTPMTCLATNMAINAVGCKIIWADVEEKTGLIDPMSVASKIVTAEKAPKAIVCMHWGGAVCKLTNLNDIGLPVIEDACQALGSTYRDKMIGNHSDFVCFSFQAIKTLTTCDGGGLAVRSPAAYERGKLLRWFCLDREMSSEMRCAQNPKEFGYKMQSNDVAASIGIANFVYLSENLNKMLRLALRYHDAIKDHQFITNSLDDKEICCSANWLYTVIVKDAPHFISFMRNNGIECSKVHARNDKKDCYKDIQANLPGVDYFDTHHVCIPCGWWLSEGEINTVLDAIRRYKNG